MNSTISIHFTGLRFFLSETGFERREAIITKEPSELFSENLEQINSVISSLCRKHRIFGSDQEDIISSLRLKLIEDDYHILRQFRQRSKLSTYLHTVIARLFIDHLRHSAGRWRPSRQAVNMGETAVKLEELLRRDTRTIEEAFHILTTNHHLSVTFEELHNIAAKLPFRKAGHIVDTGDELLDTLSSEQPSPDRVMQLKDEDRLKQSICLVIDEVRSYLSPEEQLIIVMRFEDNMPVSEIAGSLGSSRSSITRSLDAILSRIRQAIAEEKISDADIRDLLSRSEQDFENEGYMQ